MRAQFKKGRLAACDTVAGGHMDLEHRFGAWLNPFITMRNNNREEKKRVQNKNN